MFPRFLGQGNKTLVPLAFCNECRLPSGLFCRVIPQFPSSVSVSKILFAKDFSPRALAKCSNYQIQYLPSLPVLVKQQLHRYQKRIVTVFVAKAYKGLSTKLLHNYHGPYRVVEKLSPVHFRLRTCSNRPVSSIAHANRMKPFLDPRNRLKAPPPDIDDELCLQDHNLSSDSFTRTHTNTDANSNLSPTTDPIDVHTHTTTYGDNH